MNRSQQSPARPRVLVTLHSGQRETEVRIQVSWRYRLSGRTAIRLLVMLVFALAAAVIAVATPAHDELARGVLCCLAGFVTGARPRSGHNL